MAAECSSHSATWAGKAVGPVKAKLRRIKRFQQLHENGHLKPFETLSGRLIELCFDNLNAVCCCEIEPIFFGDSCITSGRWGERVRSIGFVID